MLGAVASASIIPLAKKAKANSVRDPAYAAIAAHKAALQAWVDTYDRYDHTRGQAYLASGKPAFTLRWRDRDVNFENLNKVREIYDRGPGSFRDLVEVEFNRIYHQLIALRSQERAWERNNGIRGLKLAEKQAAWEMHAAQIRIGETKPTSSAGAAALLKYVLKDMCDYQKTGAVDEHHYEAIRNVAAFLRSLPPVTTATAVAAA